MADQKPKAEAANKVDSSDPGEIGEIVDLVKTYVRQETIGPLKGLGRKVGVGVAGAALIGMGILFLALGLLRLLQHKVPRLATGSWSWASYAIVVAFCGIITFIALNRIKKLEKELR